MSKVFSVRLADEVAARVEEIAASRDAKAPTVIKAAVESYVDEHDRGLPDAPVADPPAEAELPQPVSAKRVRDMSPPEAATELARLRGIAAQHAAREKAERERKYAERGW